MNLKFSALLCSISALLLILSFPTPNIEPLAWIGLIPLLVAIDGKDPKEAFLLSYLSGLIFFLGILYWIAHVTFLGLIILVLYLALYFGVFGLLVSVVLSPKSKLQSQKFRLRSSYLGAWTIIFIPSLWVALEFARSHLFTGFGWALLGYSQYLNLPVIQISDITGAYGISFLVVVVNVAIKEVISFKRPLAFILIILLFLTVFLSYGFFKLHYKLEGDKLRVSVIQGNIPQQEKWDRELKGLILERYERLTRSAAFDRPQIVIWPETSVPGYLQDDPVLLDRISQLVKEIRIPLLAGTATTSVCSKLVERKKGTDTRNYYNSAVLISKEGKIATRYDKLHLVPFGEYLPFERFIPFMKRIVPIIGNFSPGSEYTLFQLPATNHQSPKFGVLICFEDIFPGLVREYVRRGADFMVNITNDAWFKDSSAPYQHAQASVFRAVENRVYVARSANTGLSCFIDSRGKIIDRVCDARGRDIFIAGYKTADITLSKFPTFYTTYGDLFAILCVVISFGLFLPLRFLKKSITTQKSLDYTD